MAMNSHFQNIDNIFKSIVKNINITGPHWIIRQIKKTYKYLHYFSSAASWILEYLVILLRLLFEW